MKVYYEIETAIRYYKPAYPARQIAGGLWSKDGQDELVDVRRWKDPPHVAFANLLLSHDRARLVFTRRYGLIRDVRQGGTVNFRGPAVMGKFQDYLRRAWRGDQKVIGQIQEGLILKIRVVPHDLEIETHDLWSLVLLLFQRDHLAGRTAVCASPDCPAPYFVTRRKGQKFCSQKCAVLVSVHRFRARTGQGRKSKRTKGGRRSRR